MQITSFICRQRWLVATRGRSNTGTTGQWVSQTFLPPWNLCYRRGIHKHATVVYNI